MGMVHCASFENFLMLIPGFVGKKKLSWSEVNNKQLLTYKAHKGQVFIWKKDLQMEQ